jgi:ferredoxin
MIKDENVCVHCGLCAERCPTAAWDMELFDLKIPYAGSKNFIPVAVGFGGNGGHS